jgi:hypothetical protein
MTSTSTGFDVRRTGGRIGAESRDLLRLLQADVPPPENVLRRRGLLPIRARMTVTILLYLQRAGGLARCGVHHPRDHPTGHWLPSRGRSRLTEGITA